MKDFTAKFEKIRQIDPKRRGLRFERLFYEIFESHKILLEKSFKTEDGSQQIDGAVEINNRIFLVEIKWERSKTLAASKLYSFLGKINSKIEGTLGLFVSYNELEENFLDSTRAGIKQNCIIINGEDNIIPIIRGELSVADYVWYIYQQASTRNRISIPISEFKSIPQKESLPADNSVWKELYEALISEDTSGDFELKLDNNFDRIENLAEKTITLYPILRKSKNINPKIDYLLNSLIDNDKNKLFASLINKLTKSHWIKYADEHILKKTKNISTLKSKKADKIAENVLSYLREHYGQWEEENKASLVLDFIYEHLSDEYKVKAACAYASIYCDTSRKEHYPQKKMADSIFSEIDAKDRWKTIKDEVNDMMEQYKADENIFGDDTDIEKTKKYVIRRIKRKFERIIEESNLKNLDRRLKRLYEQA
jgi:hypothetical protein